MPDASYYTVQFCPNCAKDTTFRPDEGTEDLFCEECGKSMEAQQ